MLIGERYEVVRELGSGGFGTTYAATDRETGASVAVKVLDLSRVDDWKAVELFEREAKALRTLDHPGIPAYVDFQPLEVERQAYLVQSLAPGTDLESLLETRRFSEAELVDLTERVLHILDYLTSLHPVVIHRDIKPSNILLAADGTVSLVDFGAVRAIAESDIGGGSTVAGTFGYMAPEQLHGEATPSSDLYGLGMTLVHLATGRSPSDFEKKRLKPDFRAHVHFSPAFEELIDTLIEPVPDDRFQTAAEALAALHTLDDDTGDAALSADAIARRRAEAEREDARRAERRKRRRAPSKPAPRAKHQRVTFTTDDEGATLAIAPSRWWRSREAHLGVYVVVGPTASLLALGWILGSVVAVAGAALILITSPTWRVRMTTRGDFLFYPRSPTRPKWVGTLRQLELETQATQKGDKIGWIRFNKGDHTVSKHFYPLSPSETGAFSSARNWARRHATSDKT